MRRLRPESARAKDDDASSATCRTAKPRPSVIGDAEGVLELLWLVLTAVLAWLRPRRDLVAENLLLRHQLAVLTRPTRTRPRARLRIWDKLLWVLARRWCAAWREHLAFVTPDTVVRWHQQGWRLFWRWKSRSRFGRPHLSPALRELIATMSRENRLWALSESEVSCSSSGSWSALVPSGATAGAARAVRPARPGARSCAIMPTTCGRPICSRCPR